MTQNRDELWEKIAHYFISTQQDGVGMALGYKSTDGSPYKSRIYEFTDAIIALIEAKCLEARIDELNSLDFTYNTPLPTIFRNGQEINFYERLDQLTKEQEDKK